LRRAGWIRTGKINWDGEEAGQKNSAWSVLEKYFIDTPIKADELPEAVEVPVEADLTGHGLPVLRGVLDLVRADARIVDFKSLGKTPEPGMALHQKSGTDVGISTHAFVPADGELRGGAGSGGLRARTRIWLYGL
jgi:hypothetical protein